MTQSDHPLTTLLAQAGHDLDMLREIGARGGPEGTLDAVLERIALDMATIDQTICEGDSDSIVETVFRPWRHRQTYAKLMEGHAALQAERAWGKSTVFVIADKLGMGGTTLYEYSQVVETFTVWGAILALTNYPLLSHSHLIVLSGTRSRKLADEQIVEALAWANDTNATVSALGRWVAETFGEEVDPRTWSDVLNSLRRALVRELARLGEGRERDMVTKMLAAIDSQPSPELWEEALAVLRRVAE